MATIKKFYYFAFVLLGTTLMLFSSCEKEDKQNKQNVPVLTTTVVTEITQTTATSGGNITDDGGVTVTGRGVCWSTSPNPTTADAHVSSGSGTGKFSVSITGLTENTAYYVRAYVTNSVGTNYGNEISFTTNFKIPGDGVTDAVGNSYTTVIIGTQEWMAENLKTTQYNDGTAIPTGHTNAQWEGLSSGAYAIYPHANIDGLNSDAEVLEAYGAIYNWYAVEMANLCPTDWHVPTDAEWTILTKYIGEDVAGTKLKSTSGWHGDGNGTDDYGFLALPVGGRGGNGGFGGVGDNGDWWSSTQGNATHAWFRNMNYLEEEVNRRYNDNRYGFSVRCLRN